MPVVPATVDTLVPDQLVIHWGKKAPLSDVEEFLTYLLETDGFGVVERGMLGPSLTADVGEGYCSIVPGHDLWSMVLAEEVAVRLARYQGGEIADGAGRVLAAAYSEESQPWGALESVGVMSLFRPRPEHATDLYSHPIIPLEDCKIAGVSFTDEQQCVVDMYYDYWARPCAFLAEEGQESVVLYRPAYRFRQVVFGASDLCKVTIIASPQSRIYGALGVRGYKVTQHKVDRKHTWTIRGQETAFHLRTRTDQAWMTRGLPLWYGGRKTDLIAPTDSDLTADQLLNRKEQHWDIIDSVWGQEWYVAAHEDGTLNPFGRIYKADPTAPLLDMPGLKPKRG